MFSGALKILVYLTLGVATILNGLIPTSGQGLASKRCKFFPNMSMANCSGNFLISAQLDGLSLDLRVLNLDRNQINVLENNVFMKTPLLQELSIAQNRLDTIYLDAFANLNSLRKLNLSENQLESINEYLFDAINIEVLDLSGNNFMYLDGKTLFRSDTLKTLYLKNCKIVSLNEMLRFLPSLETVDLSSNFLVSLAIPSFVPLIQLHFVDLEKNNFRCDKSTQFLFNWLKENEIEYKTSQICAMHRSSTNGDKFQRMEMTDLDLINQSDIAENDVLRNTSLARINATQVEKELVMSLFNKTYFKRCLIMDHEFVCHLLENCKNSLNCEKYLNEQQKHTHLNFYFVIVIFIIGVFIGCILALCCCQACLYCRMDKQRARQRRTRQFAGASYTGVQMRPLDRSRSAGDQNRDTQQQQNAEEVGETDTDRTAVVESNGFHEFVNELFSRRRSRRQMISAFSQQGTNLVRQLSRSSMNLLRRSQYRTNNANARAAGGSQQREQSQPAPSSPVYEVLMYSGTPLDQTQPRRVRSNSFTYSAEMVNNSNGNDYLIEDLMRQQQQNRRSESPPPNYELCVTVPKKSGHVSD